MELKGFKISIILLRQNDGNKPYTYYDFSKYAQLGFGQALNLDDTLDTMEITLIGLPFREKFEPTSLFRVVISQDFIDNGESGSFKKTYDYALQQDDVEQPSMYKELFTHNLTLVNPAIICQQRSVDNIAITYKLQDVMLSSKPADVDYDSTIESAVYNANYPNSFLPDNDINFGLVNLDFWTQYQNIAYRYRFKFPNTLSYPQGTITENNRGSAIYSYTPDRINELKQYYLYGNGQPVEIDGEWYDTANSISFNPPLIEIQGSVDGTRDYETIGFLPTRVVITDTNLATDVVTTHTLDVYPSKYIDTNSNTEISKWDKPRPVSLQHKFRYIYDEELKVECIVAYDEYDEDVLVNNRPKNRTITINFTADELHKIDVRITRLPLIQEKWSEGGEQYGGSPTPNPLAIYSNTNVFLFQQQHIYNRVDDDLNLYMEFSFRYYPQDNNVISLFEQSKQVDAYYLFKKAQLATLPIKKTNGTPYYDSDLPFFVSEADKTLLERTLLVESDFIGKNLWEVFTEIGKYIHAKPIVSIETTPYNTYDLNMTGRFLVSFLRYGNPTINNIQENTNSIFNSRFAQEYIAELDNYVENYFNLGSYVEEYLHISSDSDDGLIYNDVAKLITKYPILEILQLQISNGAETHDMTRYVFEWNVYRTLSFDTTDIPTKHRAIYYHLGSNIIEGLQFVTPASTGVECAYSMKNIIALLFNVSSATAQMNDYYFIIKYRVKDNARVSITRPDLRKYLLNSDYDPFPLHTQFNQQQDKIISSDSFGLNAYGKLIRTGNTTYEYNNWTKDINKIMNEGDLYNTADGLYYVSKVNRVYYAEHIEEKVELTKDFNRLSQIIGIPSQPRFYEISERNIINRDVKFNDYIYVSAVKKNDYVSSGNQITLIESTTINAILAPNTYIPNGVITLCKGDGDKKYDTDSNKMLEQIYTPLVSYSSKNTFTLEWDMEDNYSAGDRNVSTGETLEWGLNLYSLLNFTRNDGTITTQNYATKDPTRYVDVYGRCDLVDFLFTKNLPLNKNAIKLLPSFNGDLINYRTYLFGGSNEDALQQIRAGLQSGVDEYESNTSGYIVAKDNRERLSFNYNIQLLLDSDRVILGNKLWIRDLTNSNTKIVLLNTELSKFDADLINEANVIASTSAIDFNNMRRYAYIPNTSLYDYFYFDIENNVSSFTSEEISQAKAYAVVREDIITNEAQSIGSNYRLVIGRNVSDLENNEKLVDFIFDKFDKRDCKTNRGQLNEIYNEIYH